MVSDATAISQLLHLTHSGPVVRIAYDMYSISDLDAAERVYTTTKPLEKDTWYTAFEPAGQPNMFSTSDCSYAAGQRRKFKPAFDAWLSYEHAADECCRLLERKFAQFADRGDKVDIGWWLTCYAFDVSGMITASILD
jgi:hypothetical protein